MSKRKEKVDSGYWVGLKIFDKFRKTVEERSNSITVQRKILKGTGENIIPLFGLYLHNKHRRKSYRSSGTEVNKQVH